MIIVWEALFYILLCAPVAVLFLPWRQMWVLVAVLVLASVAIWASLSISSEAGEDAPGLLLFVPMWLLWKGAIILLVILRVVLYRIDPDL